MSGISEQSARKMPRGTARTSRPLVLEPAMHQEVPGPRLLVPVGNARPGANRLGASGSNGPEKEREAHGRHSPKPDVVRKQHSKVHHERIQTDHRIPRGA